MMYYYLRSLKNIFLYLVYSKMFNKKKNNEMKFNLQQGKDLLEYNNDINKLVDPHLKIIQNGSIIEGLDGTNMNENDKRSLNTLQHSENIFNKTLAEYSELYKQFSEDLLMRNQTKQKIVNYLGKVIDTKEGNIYYVNNFGYTHKYSENDWEHNNSSCPNTTIRYSGSMNDFEKALPMNKGQPCKIAGQNIKNKETGEEAWVDIKGVKHPYSSDRKNESCKTKPIMLSGRDYNLIPSGSAMTSTRECLSLDVNPKLWTQLQELNKKLKDQAIQLTNEINNMSIENKETQSQLMYRRQQLLKYIDTIGTSKEETSYNTKMLMQVAGEQNDSSLRMNANYYQYILWIFLMIVIILLIIGAYNSDNTSVTGIAYVIIAIFILFLLANIYKRFSNVSIVY